MLPNTPNITDRDDQGRTQLWHAASKGQIETVNALLHNEPCIDVNIPNSSGWTPLMVASLCGHTDVVQALLNHDRCEVSASNTEQATALHIACKRGGYKIVSLLLEKIIDTDACDRMGNTVLHAAVLGSRSCIETFELVLKTCPGQVTVRNQEGYTPMHLAALNGFTNALVIFNNAHPLEFLKCSDELLNLARQKNRKESSEMIEKFIHKHSTASLISRLHGYKEKCKSQTEIIKSQAEVINDQRKSIELLEMTLEEHQSPVEVLLLPTVALEEPSS